MPIKTPLVRRGVDEHLVDNETGESVHYMLSVYCEMILQICLDYPGLPDVRMLKLRQIRFFYEGRRASLREVTKPRDKPKK